MIGVVVGIAAGPSSAAPPAPVWSLDLAASDGGLIDGGETGQWAWDDPGTGPVGLGPCWGTNPDALYLHDTVDWLVIQLPDLSAVAEPAVVLRHWYAIAEGDHGVIEIDGGTGFVPLTPVYGYPAPEGFVGRSEGYVDAVLDLRGWTGQPRIRLTFTSDDAQADAGWYLQHVALYDGDVVAPVAVPVAVPEDTQDLEGPYRVELDIDDDRGVTSAVVRAEIAGDEVVFPMTRGAGLRWGSDLPPQPPDTTVRWWVEATDGRNVGRWPPDTDEVFRVYLAAPTGLSGPAEPHIVATHVDLSWDPPDSPHPVLGYRVYRELGIGFAAEVVEPTARVAVADPQRYWVEAVYAAGVGDPSEVLQLEVEVPRLGEVRPEAAFQGQQLYVHLAGTSLYLLDGATELDLGPDVRIVELDVHDVNTATARVEVAPDAAVGPQEITLVGTAGTFTFPDRFRVVDGAEAPHIVRITPAAVLQAHEVTLEIEATEPFARPPAITVDDDLVVTSDVDVDGAVARFGLAVSGAARLGLHSIAVDDGDRLYTVDLRVDEFSPFLDSGCRCAGGGRSGPGAGLLMLAVAAAAAAALRTQIRSDVNAS